MKGRKHTPEQSWPSFGRRTGCSARGKNWGRDCQGAGQPRAHLRSRAQPVRRHEGGRRPGRCAGGRARLVAGQALDLEMLKEVARGNF
jgi:hypothetical protein